MEIEKKSYVDLEIPIFWEELVSDYHEFEYLQKKYQRLLHKTVLFEEVGVVHGDYAAVFWLEEEKKPVNLIASYNEIA